jgi:hypothetical protein
MSAKIMGLVWEMDLPHNEQLVLLAMADHADHDGQNVYPSTGLLAWKCGYTEVTVSAIRKKLVERGILKVISSEPGRVKHYAIDVSAAPMKMPRTPPKKFDPPRNLTPQIAALPHPPNSCLGGTPQIAALPEPSYKSSKEPSEITPADAGDVSPPVIELKKSDASKANGKHQEFIRLWSDAFLRCTGFPYLFAGGKDGANVKRLVSNGQTPAQLIELAEFAWEPGNMSQFYSSNSQSIGGFMKFLPQIQHAFVAKRGRKLSAEEREENVRNGQAHLNTLADW